VHVLVKEKCSDEFCLENKVNEVAILCSVDLLYCVTETIQVMEDRMLASPVLKYNRDLHTPRLAEMFEGACSNCLKIYNKKTFRLPMGILRVK
jgi:hypothetical protein